LAKLKNQVPFNDLKKPVLIALFWNDGIGAERLIKRADEIREGLDEAGIKFAAIDYAPPIEIYVEEDDLPKVEELHKAGKIKLPSVFESWSTK